MRERLLHTVWQHSLYNPSDMKTEDGEKVVVVTPGVYNTNAGPDFLEAKVIVGDTTLVGHVEMHVHSSDWLKHGHQDDDAYKNVILHVVYNNDRKDVLENTPTLCIASHIHEGVNERYAYLMNKKHQLPCASQLGEVKDIVKSSWLTRLLAERWQGKLATWQELLDNSKGDWSSLLYWRLAANFGFKTNADAFLALAQSLPLKVLAKHKDSLQQLEALLLGQAGMLSDDFNDKYLVDLRQEYDYLSKKYELEPIEVSRWKFMRMRPANFPTIRIVQFAALIHKSVHLFANIIEKDSIKTIMPLFEVEASDYWNDHYRLDEQAEKSQKKKLGKTSIQNIIINTVAPIKFLYASEHASVDVQEEALKLLDELPAEKNHIITSWIEHNWAPRNASQSQAQIELYNNYCSKKKCLDCTIGLSLVKS